MAGRTRLYEHVSDAIRLKVVRGELVVGQRLPTERDLAVSHGVSRNVVREAMRLLVREGLVEVKQGSGTYVTDGTSRALGETISLAFAVGQVPDRVAQLLEVRQILEPELAALAANRCSGDDIEQLHRAIVAMDAAARNEDRFIAADYQFHLRIARASGNSIIPKMLDPIVDLLTEQRKQAFRLEDTGRAQQFHRSILTAIETHDPSAAYLAMRAHLEVVGKGVSAEL